jgi:hypothetical protein
MAGDSPLDRYRRTMRIKLLLSLAVAAALIATGVYIYLAGG